VLNKGGGEKIRYYDSALAHLDYRTLFLSTRS